jgi:ABC-2 type transport system permease protein
MPGWVQRIANVLPYRYTFGFPIEALVGSSRPVDPLAGIAMQVSWIMAGAIAVSIGRRFAIRQFSSVGN